MGNDRLDRGAPRPRISPAVQRLLDNAPSYEPRARLDDGLCINEIIHVRAQQPGAASALHAKWQFEGAIQNLTKDECEALGRAGYRVQKDRDGFWAWWREKRLSHLWLVVASEGWMSTNAPHPRGARWKLIGSIVDPIVPYFPDYPVTPRSILREGLTLAMTAIQEELPATLPQDKFFAVAKELCDEAAMNLERDHEWLEDILKRVPTVNPTDSFSDEQMDDQDYTGGVVRS